MSFSVRIKASAVRELKRITIPDRERIVNAIDRLKENPYLGTTLKGNLTGLRRLRVGDYRIVYEIQQDALIVLVVRVAHRSDAYR